MYFFHIFSDLTLFLQRDEKKQKLKKEAKEILGILRKEEWEREDVNGNEMQREEEEGALQEP